MTQKIIFTPTTEDALLLDRPPAPAISLIPNWYKDIPPMYGDGKFHLTEGKNNRTLKACMPFFDAMTAGYIFTLNEDIIVSWSPDGVVPIFNWRSGREPISFHTVEQHQGIPVPDGYSMFVMKFENQWQISLPDGYSLFCTHPANRYDLPFQTLSGFVDADTFPLTIAFPFFIKNGWEGIIETRTPIVQYIPIKRDNWISSVREHNEKEFKKNYFFFLRKIMNSYKNQYWHRKSYK